MKLSLLIQVCNGGSYWKECWESVLLNQDCFDRIFVSINQSSTQEEDIALIRDCKLEKLHWISQDQSLAAVEHRIKAERWLMTFHPTGHIFLLNHDCMLLRAGLLELKGKNLGTDEAVFGGYCLFSPGGKSRREMVVHEFCSDSNFPITSEQFIFMFEDQMLNISGIVLPAAIFARKHLPWHMLRSGCRAELCYLANPYIKHICQMISPTVKVRWHQSSETSHTPENAFLYDSLVLYCHVFSVFPNDALRMKMVANIGDLIKKNLWLGLLYFIQIQFSLLRLNYYYPAALKIYWYAILKIFRRTGF